jgi:hypothetical protein
MSSIFIARVWSAAVPHPQQARIIGTSQSLRSLRLAAAEDCRAPAPVWELRPSWIEDVCEQTLHGRFEETQNMGVLMKSISILGLALLLGTTGCYTSRYAESGRSHGTKQTFAAPFGAVWRAAVDAAQQGDLAVVSADRERGYIHARRTIQPHTFGENVGVWITSLSPTETTVEVVSRQAGPPVAWVKNWENEVLNAVAANLTREIPTATGGVGTTTYSTIDSGSSVTVNVPATPPPKTTAEIIAEEQRRLDDLRRQEDLRLKDLDREKDITRREKISAEIDRLRAELRTISDRIADLESEQRRLK